MAKVPCPSESSRVGDLGRSGCPITVFDCIVGSLGLPLWVKSGESVRSGILMSGENAF